MTTAFQRDAFQNNAFQIDFTDTHDGGGFKLPVYVGKGYKRRKLSNILHVYNEAQQTIAREPETKRLLSLVDAYIDPADGIEQQKRESAQYIVDDLPNIDRINMVALVQNQMAVDILLAEIDSIEARLHTEKSNREDDMTLIMLAAVV